MDSFRENLSALGVVEAGLSAFERELIELPESIAAAEARAEAARAASTAEGEAAAAVDKARRDKEAELADCEAKRDKFQGQTALVKTNHEYTALLGEIEGMTSRISEIEEEILKAMESDDGASERLAAVQKEQKELEQAAERDAGELRKRMAQVEKERAEQRTIRDGLLEELGPKVKAHYQRIASARGTAVALVRADNCTGCHRSVPPEVSNRVMAGEMHVCANCQRILIIRQD